MSQQSNLLTTERGRQWLVTAALNIVDGTSLAPKQYEKMLLDQFVLGDLTIDQVIARLDSQEHE